MKRVELVCALPLLLWYGVMSVFKMKLLARLFTLSKGKTN